jgi:hypothetical protein
MNFVVLEPALLELEDACSYYDSPNQALGKRFIESFKATVILIQKIPFGWRKISQNTRRINFKGFPYLILYIVDGDTIVITCICHSHRNLEYYKKYYK